VLDDFGLVGALCMDVESLRAEGWTVDFDEQLGPDRLPPHVETALYRVCQEALANARAHAMTRRARLAVQRRDQRVHVEVRDWGRGFVVGDTQGAAEALGHIGVAGMQERIALLGGRCVVQSRPGWGTRVRVVVPLAGIPAGSR
jgi:signal transduction histidine kinase